VKKTIAVCGSDGEIPKDVEELAELIGATLAENDVVVVCGGRGGVMEAVCRGAKSKDGITVGLLPSGEKKEANPYVDIALPTTLGFARNTLVAASADAIVTMHGSTGTLSEIALALNNKKHVFIIEDTGGVSGRFGDILKGDKRGHLVHKTTKEKVVGELLNFLKTI